MPDDDLSLAIHLAQAGQSSSSLRMLREYVSTHPSDVQGWLWLAYVADTVPEKQSALQSALAIDPGNPYAKSELLSLYRTQQSSPTQMLPPSHAAADPRHPSHVVQAPSSKRVNIERWQVWALLGFAAIAMASLIAVFAVMLPDLTPASTGPASAPVQLPPAWTPTALPPPPTTTRPPSTPTKDTYCPGSAVAAYLARKSEIMDWEHQANTAALAAGLTPSTGRVMYGETQLELEDASSLVPPPCLASAHGYWVEYVTARLNLWAAVANGDIPAAQRYASEADARLHEMERAMPQLPGQ